MQKQKRLDQNLEESKSDSDSEDYSDEFQNHNKTEDVTRDGEEDQIQDSKTTAQERRLGIDISMRGTRESNLGSTRSQTQRIISTFKSPMKECTGPILNNWVQESCFKSALTSDPEEPKTFNEAWNHQEQKIRNLWREVIKKALNSMEFKKVWTEKQKE